MKSVILINGKKQSKLSVFNRLVQFGDGLFETCMVKDGKLILAQQHFARLDKGSQRLHINPIKQSVWLKDIAKAVSLSKLNHAVVKIILSRGETSRGYGFDRNIKPTRIVIVSEMPDLASNYSLGLCASGYATNQLLAEIKHCNRLEQILARTNLNTQECLMLDPQGQVISVSQGNVFAFKNGVLLTPSLDVCGIEGTRRQAVIGLAKKLNISVEVCSLSMEELLSCDEIFITNSVIGIKPVHQVNEQNFSQYSLTEKLSNNFDKYLSKRKNSIPLRLKKGFVKFGLLLALGLILAWSFWANNINTVKATIYELPKGATIYSTANDLKRYGLVNSSLFVLWSAKLSGADAQLKSGYYDVSPGMGVWQLLKDFSTANVATRNISLIEGRTVREYYQLLSNNKALTNKYSLDKTLENSIAEVPYEASFWPDTYQINYGDSVVSVLDRVHVILQEKLDSAWKGRVKNHPLSSANQALILASLIERETANSAEKSKISGVFINRLKKNMRLQTDPTVVYALGDAYTGKLSKKDLWVKSPYNTYRNKGLPPGPIGSVGQDSLTAAMHPLKTEYLFFVAKKDGSHAFAKTYKQHLTNIKKHLK